MDVFENLGCATFQFFLSALHTRIFKSNAKRQKHSKKSLTGLFAHMMFYQLFSPGFEQALKYLFVLLSADPLLAGPAMLKPATGVEDG